MELDCLIIGGGPAGLAVANSLHKAGINYLVIEKGPIANHIMQFPVFMGFFSSRDLLVIDEFPMTIPDEKPDRRQYLTYLNNFVKSRGLKVLTFTEVCEVNQHKEGETGFDVLLRDHKGTEAKIYAKTVVAACGAYEKPRLIHVPGEELPKVSHHFKEPHPYFGKKVMVVGGRNSAIEVALLLHRAGVEVSLSYRKGDLNGSGIKYWLKPDIEKRLEKEEIKPYMNTSVVRIEPDHVILESLTEYEQIKVENDFVLLLTGYEPPVDFLRKIGVNLTDETHIPDFNPETLETPTPGLFVAGVITGGNISGKVFIENSRHHGELILKRLKEIL